MNVGVAHIMREASGKEQHWTLYNKLSNVFNTRSNSTTLSLESHGAIPFLFENHLERDFLLPEALTNDPET